MHVQLFEVLDNDVNKPRHSCGRTLSIYVKRKNIYLALNLCFIFIRIWWWIFYGPFVQFCSFHIGHCLYLQVMPENFYRGKRPPFPLWNKNIKIIVGEPMELDLPKMRQMAMSLSRNISHPTLGWPSTCPGGLDEAAQRCLYIAISEKIQNVMETLRTFARSFSKSKDQNLC